MIIHFPRELAMMAVNQRKKLGLTQEDVADRVGLKQKTISAFENRPERVRLSTAFLILSALGLNLELNITKEIKGWKEEW